MAPSTGWLGLLLVCAPSLVASRDARPCLPKLRPTVEVASTTTRARPAAPLKLDGETRLQLTVLMATGLLNQLSTGLVIPVLPKLAQRLQLDESGVGLLVAMPSIAKVVLNLPFGAIVDAFGRIGPLVAGSLIYSLGCILTAQAGGLGSIVVARLLLGCGAAATATANLAYLYDVVEKHPAHRGLLLGSVHAVNMLAFAAGPSLGGLLADSWGVAAPFQLVGLLLLCCAPLYALLPETKRAAKHSGRVAAAAVAEAASSRRRWAALQSHVHLLRHRNQLALLLMRVGLFTGWSAALTVVPLQASHAWSATPGDIGFTYTLICVAGLVAAPAGGHLADRLGCRPTAFLGALLCACSNGLLPLAYSKWPFLALTAVWGAAAGLTAAALAALSADVTAVEHRGAQAR